MKRTYVAGHLGMVGSALVRELRLLLPLLRLEVFMLIALIPQNLFMIT